MKRTILKMKGKAAIFAVQNDKKALFRFNISKIRLRVKFICLIIKTLSPGYFPI